MKKRELAISLLEEYIQELKQGERFYFGAKLITITKDFKKQSVNCIPEENFMVEGVAYETLTDVMRATGIACEVSVNRFKSSNFPLWYSPLFKKTEKNAKYRYRASSCVINNKPYKSINQAAIDMQMSVGSVYYRLNSDLHPTWKYNET